MFKRVVCKLCCMVRGSMSITWSSIKRHCAVTCQENNIVRNQKLNRLALNFLMKQLPIKKHFLQANQPAGVKKLKPTLFAAADGSFPQEEIAITTNSDKPTEEPKWCNRGKFHILYYPLHRIASAPQSDGEKQPRLVTEAKPCCTFTP